MQVNEERKKKTLGKDDENSPQKKNALLSDVKDHHVGCDGVDGSVSWINRPAREGYIAFRFYAVCWPATSRRVFFVIRVQRHLYIDTAIQTRYSRW